MDRLNNYTTTDNYSPNVGQVKQPGTKRIDLLIYNAAVYVQLCDDSGGFEPTETFLPPGERSFDWVCGGLRVRSAVPGTPAQVTIILLNSQDISDTIR